MKNRPLTIILALLLVLGMVACTPATQPSADPTPEAPVVDVAPSPEPADEGPANPIIRLSTTTSVNDSGLLPYLQPEFEADTGYKLEITSAGTGAAIEKGRTGDADALLVHSKSAEETFISEGFAAERIPFMYNYFVILGPADDPAGVGSAANATEAFKAIAEGGFTFISRGDSSGTHNAENKIWAAAQIEPNPEKDSWYVSAGQGMGACITMAAEEQAYVLSDKATYLAHEMRPQLNLLLERSDEMKNTYSMLAISPDKWADTNIDGANAFIEWMQGEKATQLIDSYGVAEYGEQLFFTMAGEIALTDVVGRTVTLPGAATKVVGTHNPSMNTAIVLGGGGKYLAGFGNKEMADGLYQYVIENFDSLTSIGKGKNINFETVASIGADLAILPERFTDQAEQYEAVGVPAIVALPNTESFDTIKNSLTLVAKALGEEARAAEICEFFDNQVTKAKEVSSKASRQPSVMFLGGSSMLTVAPEAMIQSYIIEAAGGKNAVTGIDVKGEFAEVNLEQIIVWNPDVIWIPAYADYTVDDILNDAGWTATNAVKNKAVYQFPSALEPWDYPTASCCLGVCWATNNLHPELYTKDELMADVDAYYTLVYGRTFTAEELGIK
ncbi:ABC transporter substrate-binding protein [Eubacteriales bacterium OttesenSCG-928-K08]|nr:ABC transporter substrate-binding protein [Eubacteriales bacterium OttesenSCG-928-K08]